MGAGQYDDPDCPEARAGLDEADPQEDADVARCDTPVERCEFRLGDLDGEGAQESEFTIMDELHEQMRVDPIRVVVDPDDGLPHPVTRDTQFAPPFTHETMVCIEDRRKYVEVFAEELGSMGWSLDHEQSETLKWLADQERTAFDERNEEMGRCSTWLVDLHGNGHSFYVRKMHDPKGNVRERDTFSPSSVQRMFGVSVVEEPPAQSNYPPRLVIVRPVRERCKHYKRMCVANDDQPDPDAFLHYIRFRNCMMRRSVGGAFLSLRDEAVYACDYRDPPDETSVRKHLDEPDEKKLSDRPDLVKVPLFGLEGDEKNEK